ncbi:MAG: hypothetical protein RL563_738 [Pseudomonadota bacterium]
MITPRMSTSITVTDLKTGIGSQDVEDISIGQENIKLASIRLSHTASLFNAYFGSLPTPTQGLVDSDSRHALAFGDVDQFKIGLQSTLLGNEYL